MVSSSSFLSEFKTDRVDPEAAPRLMVGAASPLWLMFGGAAAAGATWWWWASRWREAVNLEALSAPVALASSPEPLALATVETVETAVEAVAEPLDVVIETALEASVETLEVANDVAFEAVTETPEVVELVAEPVAETVEPVAAATVEVVEQSEVPEAVEAVAEAPLAVAEAAIDDLTRVVGIGPKLAASLAELGVTRFSQMAAWTPEELKSIDELLNLKGRADRDAWIAQAKRFAGAPEA